MRTVYAGMDFGWKSFRYEIRNEKNQVMERGGAPSNPEGLKKVLEKFDGVTVYVAYEAGSQLYWVDGVIKEKNHVSHPFHAAYFQMTVKAKNKTDKKDAEKMAVAAVKENLPPKVYVAEGIERKLRERVKERESYKSDLICVGNRLHALAITEGFRLGKPSLSQKIENWEKALELFVPTGREKEAKRLYRSALILFQTLEEIEEEIKELVSEGEWGEARRRLETIPGIGFWTAVGILAWSGVRACRFRKSRNAASYFGLTRSTYESGQISRPGHITKCGPPVVRKWLTQAAWAFIRSREGRESRWGQWKTKMASRNKDFRKKSTIALARRLLTAAIACLHNETEWNPEVLTSKR